MRTTYFKHRGDKAVYSFPWHESRDADDARRTESRIRFRKWSRRDRRLRIGDDGDAFGRDAPEPDDALQVFARNDDVTCMTRNECFDGTQCEHRKRHVFRLHKIIERKPNTEAL